MLKTITKTTLAVSAIALLAACSCQVPVHSHHHKMKHHQVPAQEVVVMETETVVAAEVIENNTMKAKMYTRSSQGGTSDMGYIKFMQTDNGTKMAVNLKDLRPGKAYTVKIYPCAENCQGNGCCSTQCMKATLPMLMIDEPGKLKQTYNIRGINWDNMNNAKVVLTRDGGYKAAWGTVYPAMTF